MLVLDNISAVVGNNDSLQRKVFDGLSVQIQEGDFVSIVGNNGSGKSTLLNVITGSVGVTHGNVMLNQENITKHSLQKRSHLVARVMQDPRKGTMENMTIYENLSLAFKRGDERRLDLFDTLQRRMFFSEKLSMLGMNLENRLDELVVNLSGGQRQALSLIMAILHPSKLLLLDEITAALDPRTAELVMKIASNIVAANKITTLMVTHNMHHAIDYGNKIIIMDNGRVAKQYDGYSKYGLSAEELALELSNLN